MDVLTMMRVFVAIASEGSFTRGAKRARISVQTASKYVQQLEERLRVPLFDRTTRSVSLTDTGRAYLDRCSEVLGQFDELEADARREHAEPRGRVRLTAPSSFGERYLAPVLAELLRRHPGLELELVLTDRKVALVEEGFDLAIRIGALADSSLVALRLAPMRVVVCAAPEYLERVGRPQHPRELAGHACIIDTNFGSPRQWPFRVDGTLLHVSVTGPFSANTPNAGRQMAVAGVGIAMCPMYAVNPDIVAGRLEILFAEHEAHDFNIYALYPSRRHLSGRVRVVVDHLARAFRRL